tara:strand:- start:4790 stop:5710 length:921 start_codon:yes stop_codon:yes gene_type:complete
MKTLNLTLVATFLGATCAFPQTTINSKPKGAENGENWTIRWDRSDDFNESEIDWKKWNPKPEKFFAWTWDNPKSTSVSDGKLKITIRHEKRAMKGKSAAGKDSGLIYTSGMLKSYAKGCYGFYEARIKGAPLFPGVCPAFWIYSTIEDSELEAGSVRYCEVDIVELTQRGNRIEGNERISDHNLHAILSNGKQGIPGRDWRRPNDPRYREAQAIEYHAPFDPREDFHTYGCHVSKDEIVWYVDGVEVGRKPNEFWHRPMNVALSFGLRSPFTVFHDNRLFANHEADVTALPTSMLVDYVRVWELKD